MENNIETTIMCRGMGVIYVCIYIYIEIQRKLLLAFQGSQARLRFRLPAFNLTSFKLPFRHLRHGFRVEP